MLLEFSALTTGWRASFPCFMWHVGYFLFWTILQLTSLPTFMSRPLWVTHIDLPYIMLITHIWLSWWVCWTQTVLWATYFCTSRRKPSQIQASLRPWRSLDVMFEVYRTTRATNCLWHQLETGAPLQASWRCMELCRPCLCASTA